MSKTFNFYCDKRREISSLRDFAQWFLFSYYQNTIPTGLLTIVIIWVLPGLIQMVNPVGMKYW